MFYVRNTLPERSPVSISIICRKSKAHNFNNMHNIKAQENMLITFWGNLLDGYRHVNVFEISKYGICILYMYLKVVAMLV